MYEFVASNTGNDIDGTQYIAMVDIVNKAVFYEYSYKNDGIFGYEDIFIRFAKMNGLYDPGINPDLMRLQAIDLYYWVSDKNKRIYPILLEISEADIGNTEALLNEAREIAEALWDLPDAL